MGNFTVPKFHYQMQFSAISFVNNAYIKLSLVNTINCLLLVVVKYKTNVEEQ